MAQNFQSVISELWARLKLGAPAFEESLTVTLTVDGIDVRLSESADGRHLLVTGVAGRLSPDLYRREQQVRSLLKTNLGMLQSSKAGVSLESSDETATVRVEAAYPYAANHLDQLTRLIEDVLFRLEFHADELAVDRRQRPASGPTLVSPAQETFIFRP